MGGDAENGDGYGEDGGTNDFERVGDETEELIPSMSPDNGGAMKRSSTRPTGDGTKTRRVGKRVVRRRKVGSAPSDEHHACIKYGSLFLLVAQMVGLVLLMRYSRTKGGSDGDGQMYLASTAVFVMEVMKFSICCAVILGQSGWNPFGLVRELHHHIVESPFEIMKLCVPSLLYTVQNNLLYFALSNLDAATYQVCYQLKILTTALFSAILLGRKFRVAKWFSLIILTAGVAFVQTSGSGDKETSSSSEATVDAAAQNRMLGLVAVLCAACTSGFSGVYFEKILKASTTSLWIRNVQMGLPSMLIALATVFVEDGVEVRERGFFVGYNSIVWTVVSVQAGGGLLVAVVVKYADNVLKVFATSFSIIVSCIFSAFLFDFRPNMMFLIGATLVVISTVVYSMPDGGDRGKKIRRRVPAGAKSPLPVTAPGSGNSQVRLRKTAA